jgi:nicotinamidase-related amidase
MPATPAKALLSPENHSLLLIDHQYLQMPTIRSHDASELIDHAVALAEAAAMFEVPLLTTAFKERRGLVAPLAEATKTVKPVDRTTLNAWEDPRIVDWVEETRRRKLVIAGQWTEVCVAMPVLSALDAGYEVFVATDACGGASREAHDMAVERMVQAGAHPITTWNYVSELQRDWARANNLVTCSAVAAIVGKAKSAATANLVERWSLCEPMPVIAQKIRARSQRLVRRCLTRPVDTRCRVI